MMNNEELVKYVATKVMKIVNKHHSDVQKNLAKHRQDIKVLEKRFNQLENSYINALGKFMPPYSSLPKKLEEINEMLIATQIGLTDVYNEVENLRKSQEELFKQQYEL